MAGIVGAHAIAGGHGLAITGRTVRGGPVRKLDAPGQHREHARRSDRARLAGGGERNKDRAREHHRKDQRGTTFHPASIAGRSRGSLALTGEKQVKKSIPHAPR